MKRLADIFALVVLLGCEGTEGPMGPSGAPGPAGPVGPQGPAVDIEVLKVRVDSLESILREIQGGGQESTDPPVAPILGLLGAIPDLASVFVNYQMLNWDADPHDDGLRIWMFLRNSEGGDAWLNSQESLVVIHVDLQIHIAIPATTTIRVETPLLHRAELLGKPSDLSSWRVAYNEIIPKAKDLGSEYFVVTSFAGINRTYVDVVLRLFVTQADGSTFEALEGYSMTIPDEW